MKSVLSMGVAAIVLALVGCSSVVKKEDGTWNVGRQIEARSPFGTNQSAFSIENCKKEIFVWYWENKYTDCIQVAEWYPGSSQGQGGQVVQGVLGPVGWGLGLSMIGRDSFGQTFNISTLNPPAPGKK